MVRIPPQRTQSYLSRFYFQRHYYLRALYGTSSTAPQNNFGPWIHLVVAVDSIPFQSPTITRRSIHSFTFVKYQPRLTPSSFLFLVPKTPPILRGRSSLRRGSSLSSTANGCGISGSSREEAQTDCLLGYSAPTDAPVFEE